MKIEPFHLERYFAKYEFKAKYMLSSSDSESMTLDDLLSFDPVLKESLGQTWLGYSESSGIPELRQAIAETYEGMGGDQILLHTGAQEPIFNLMNATLSAGDHVIVHSPCYQSFYSVPQALGCKVDFWRAQGDQGWRLDLEELKKLIRPETKLVVANFPHNPTGYICTHAEQLELIALLRHHGIRFLSDEIYRGLELNPDSRLPAACDLYKNAVSLGGLAKSYGLAGLRIGWIATKNTDVYAKMAAFKDYTTICNPILSERLATIAIRNREPIIAKNRQLLTAHQEQLTRFFANHADHFEFTPLLGGTMVFPRAKRLDMEKFSLRLLEEKSVMLISGKYFADDHARFRLGLARKNFLEVFAIAMEAMGFNFEA